MTRIIVLILLTIVLFTFVSLVKGATYLLWLLPGGLPFGKGLTAAGLTSAAVVALVLSKPVCSDVDVVGDCAKLNEQDVGAEPIRNHLAGRFWTKAAVQST